MLALLRDSRLIAFYLRQHFASSTRSPVHAEHRRRIGGITTSSRKTVTYSPTRVVTATRITSKRKSCVSRHVLVRKPLMLCDLPHSHFSLVSARQEELTKVSPPIHLSIPKNSMRKWIAKLRTGSERPAMPHAVKDTDGSLELLS